MLNTTCVEGLSFSLTSVSEELNYTKNIFSFLFKKGGKTWIRMLDKDHHSDTLNTVEVNERVKGDLIGNM